jgi:dihydroorotate dehydrogenase
MDTLVRRLLFTLDPERAHEWALRCLDGAARLGWSNAPPMGTPDESVALMGLQFPNRVGAAAGMDKNADHVRGLSALGFGFIEVGTVTPRGQTGNSRPRLFRIPERRAVINRLGFNNAGVDYLLERLAHARTDAVIGVNIGKNRDTPMAAAVGDYVDAFERVHACADYVAVNLSSPNTPGLRALQAGEALHELLGELKQRQGHLAKEQGRYVPLVIKIAPDMSDDELVTLARALVAAQVDGVTATNTTTDHSAVAGFRNGDETGGLSGAPLMAPSTAVLARLRAVVGPKLPIIGVGGVLTGDDAVAKYRAGADLVQAYTGLIYRGGRLVREMRQALADTSPRQG